MRIVTKINIVLVLFVAGLLALDYTVLRFTLVPSFAYIELQDARENQSRLLEAIERIKDQVLNTTRDYANWDDTYKFVKTKSPDYVAANVIESGLKNVSTNYFSIVDAAGHVLVDSGFDYSSGPPSELHLLGRGTLSTTDPLLKVIGERKPRSFLLKTNRGLVAAGIAPILRSDQGGEPNAVLIIGRIIDPILLRETTRVDVTIDLTPNPVIPETHVATGSNSVRISTPLIGDQGKAIGLLSSATRRDVSELGQRTLVITLCFVTGITLALLGSLAVLFKRLVLSRIGVIHRHLHAVAESGNLSPLPADPNDDELSDVVSAFNTMTAQLGELRERLRDADYRAGAADNASGILHNVRNGVTPIGVIAWDLMALDEAGWTLSARKAVAELKTSQPDADRTLKLTQFLAKSAERLLEQAEERKADLANVQTLVREVSEILMTQDASANHATQTEKVSLERALRLGALLIQNRSRTPVTCPLPADIPVASGNQVVLNQVIGNIYLNAAEAVEGRDGEGIVSVGITPSLHDGRAAYDVAVTDNGEGIAADRLTAIFERGVSTRHGRAGGIGLHWCANAMARMGGRVFAESAGVGRGATIHVILPCWDERNTKVAQKAMAAAA